MSAMRCASEWDKDGVLSPSETDEKRIISQGFTNKKHPDGRDSNIVDLLTFDPDPDTTDTQITDYKVEEVTKRVSGSSRPSGLCSLASSHWLLKHGGTSLSLRRIISKLVELPWAEFRALTWGRLVSFCKISEVYPTGVGNILRHFFVAKFIFQSQD